MLQAQKDQLKFIDVRAPLWRALLLLPVILALAVAWFTGRWYLGNTMAEFAPPEDQGGLESARAAVELASDDPLVHFILGNMEKDTLLPERLPEAVKQYEEAVKLSPYDYRYWLALGRTRELAGEVEGGEKALRRAVELAPSYSYPRWYLGNLLFRANRREEAFKELRLAGESNSLFMPQVCILAWYAFEGNVAEIEKVVGDKALTRAQLAVFLASKEKPDDALRLWQSLSAEERKQWPDIGVSLLRTLIEKASYRAAIEIAKEVKPETAGDINRLVNEGFESGVGGSDPVSFGWRVAPIQQTEITIDPNVKHSGNRSLRVVFNGYSTNTFANIWQVVALEPNTRYRLDFYVRTKDLKTGGAPTVEVANPLNSVPIAKSQPIPTDTNDWQQMTIEFTSLDKPDGLVVRTNRIPCEPLCPIYGTVWYDDFNLQRIGPAETRRAENIGSRGPDTKPTPAR